MVPLDKLDQITRRFEFLEAKLAAGAAPGEIAPLGREYSGLKPVVAEIVTDGHIAVVGVFARQRFGRGDFGVNAARLKGWIGQLTP